MTFATKPEDHLEALDDAVANARLLLDPSANANALDKNNAIARLARSYRKFELSLNGQSESIDLDSSRPMAGLTLKTLLGTDFPETVWIVENLVQKANTTLFFGASYTGKSLLAWHLATLAARGFGSFLDRAVITTPQRVGLFIGENSYKEAQEIIRKQLAGDPPPDTLTVYDALSTENQAAPDHKPDITTTEGRARYEKTVRSTPLDVVILDNLMSLGHQNLNDSEIARSTMLWMKRLSKELGTTWIIVEHLRKSSSKGDEASPLDQLYGAHEWGSLSDAAHHIAFTDKNRRDSQERILTTTKLRGARPSPPQILALDEQTWTARVLCEAGQESDSNRSVSPDQLLDILKNSSAQPVSREELAQAAGISDRTLKRILNDPCWRLFESDGRVKITARNRKNSPTHFSTETSIK